MGFSPEQLGELNRSLDPRHVKQRDQANRKVSYIEAWHCIAEANRIFGFDGWDREMAECKCVAERETTIGGPTQYYPDRAGKDGWRVGYIARVRIAVRAGEGANWRTIIREGTGYGSGIDVDLGQAHESAIKEAESDAMKRALITFGNPFGLSLYDKDSPVRPTSAAIRNATSAGASPGLSSTGETPKEKVYRIKRAIDIAAKPAAVDDILRINAADLQLIEAASKGAKTPGGQRAYIDLLAYAGERKAELAQPPTDPALQQWRDDQLRDKVTERLGA
jgi:hypothetical protein